MYRVAIVEDDPQEATTLQGHVERYAKEQNLAMEATLFSSAVEFEEASPRWDLIFMDIDLPGINGMEAAEELRDNGDRTPLVFVTNLAQYAVHGYAVDAIDFIVKPVTYGRFAMRMERVMRYVRHNESENVAVTTSDGMRVFPLSKLVCIEVRNHNLAYHLAGSADPIIVRGTLSKVEKELARAPIVRISASCIANMAHIQTISGNELTMDDGETLYFSRAKRNAGLARIADYLGGTL